MRCLPIIAISPVGAYRSLLIDFAADQSGDL